MDIVVACNKSLFSLFIPRDIVSIYTLQMETFLYENYYGCDRMYMICTHPLLAQMFLHTHWPETFQNSSCRQDNLILCPLVR